MLANSNTNFFVLFLYIVIWGPIITQFSSGRPVFQLPRYTKSFAFYKRPIPSNQSSLYCPKYLSPFWYYHRIILYVFMIFENIINYFKLIMYSTLLINNYVSINEHMVHWKKSVFWKSRFDARVWLTRCFEIFKKVFRNDFWNDI